MGVPDGRGLLAVADGGDGGSTRCFPRHFHAGGVAKNHEQPSETAQNQQKEAFRLIVANDHNNSISITGVDFHFDRIGFDAANSGRTDLGQHGHRYGRDEGKTQSGFLRQGSGPCLFAATTRSKIIWKDSIQAGGSCFLGIALAHSPWLRNSRILFWILSDGRLTPRSQSLIETT